MKKLDERYQSPSGYRIWELFTRLFNIRYEIGTDPTQFISKFSGIMNQIHTLIPDFPRLPDNVQAHLILAKLPTQMKTVQDAFATPLTTPTVSGIHQYLRNIYLASYNGITPPINKAIKSEPKEAIEDTSDHENIEDEGVHATISRNRRSKYKKRYTPQLQSNEQSESESEHQEGENTFTEDISDPEPIVF